MIKPVLFLLFLSAASRAWGEPAFVSLAKDGEITKWTPSGRTKIGTVAHALDLATCADGAVWVLTDSDVRALETAPHTSRAPKRPRYRITKGTAITCDAHLFLATVDGKILQLALHGSVKQIASYEHVRFLFSDSQESFAATEHALVALERAEKYEMAGLPIAAAVTEKFIYVIDRDGGFQQIDRVSRQVKELNIGLWWGALGIAAIDDALYVVTQVGKLWRIVPSAHEKEIVEMDGWQSTIAIARLPIMPTPPVKAE